MRSTDAEPGKIEQIEDGNGNVRHDERGRVSNGRSGPSLALILFLIVAAYAIAFFFRNSHADRRSTSCSATRTRRCGGRC